MKKKIFVLAAIATLALGGWRYWQQQDYVTTDNAYVSGDITVISPEVSGHVVKLNVDDNQWVDAGELLFMIDDSEYRANVDIATAAIEVARSVLLNNQARITLQQVSIEQAKIAITGIEANTEFQRSEELRYDRLLGSSSISQTAYDSQHTKTIAANVELTNAYLTLSANEKQLDTLSAEREQLKAELRQAESRLVLDTIALSRTKVTAPVAGYVTNRQVQTGKFVQAGVGGITLVPSQVWLNANFKETQLTHVDVGQQVEVMLDMFPDTSIIGVVDSITPATGAQFSLLQAQNATGNFVKVVQRVPVKIRMSLPPELIGRVYPGLSATASVRISL